MNISVFIPTYNGKDKVRGLLTRMRQQTQPDFSVHVLIDGSSDNTIALRDEFPEYQFHSFSNAGRSGIRNRSLQIAAEGIILFLDHDMLPEKDLIQKHLQAHEENPHTIIVGNGFRNPAAAPDLFGAYLSVTEQKWIESHPPSFQVTGDNFVFTACNLSMPVKIFRSLHGFNEVLKDGEDFEFAMRAMKSGISIFYDRRLLAWHDDWPTLSGYIQRNSEYLAAKKVLVKMNPDYEKFLRVHAGERSHNKFKQFLQGVIGRTALRNSWLFRIYPLKLKFLAFRSAIYKFTSA